MSFPHLFMTMFSFLFTMLAMSPKECEQWVRGLRNLATETQTAPYPVHVNCWLRKEFEVVKNAKETYDYNL